MRPTPRPAGNAREQLALRWRDGSLDQGEVQLDLEKGSQELGLTTAVTTQPIHLLVHRVIGPLAGVEQLDGQAHLGARRGACGA